MQISNNAKTLHHLDHALPAQGQRLRRVPVAFEDQIECVAIGDIKECQRRNRGMDIDGIQAFSKDALLHSALVKLLDGLDHRHIEFLYQLTLRQIFPALDVLRHHITDCP